MHDLSSYQFATLWEDGELALSRGVRGVESVLAITTTATQLTARGLARLQHAFALRDELDTAWAARPIALVEHHGYPMLLCADPGGDVLARPQQRSLAARLRIAVGVAAALRQLHARRIVHKDIKPANVLVDASGAVWLTGFGLASRVPRERQALEPPEAIAGSFAYMAPEQTGRMNRSIDSRTDLYALGVTLYELFSEALPFTASEPMEWIHCHIARQPVPLFAHAPAVPRVISDIVMTLLAKPAEERYQTAAGVEHDLRHALGALESGGAIAPFSLGTHDASDRLLVPERLIGRDAEIAALRASLDDVIAHGDARLVLVAGYAGIGKSSIVNELHRTLVASRGRFAAGKFDQYQRGTPYAALAQVLGELVTRVLASSEIADWRARLLEHLGGHGQLIVQLVPELALVIGEQPQLPALAPDDARARFHGALRRFLGAFATAEHPLVVFLDDLQWLDVATLGALEALLAVRHLLIIGAYRDNEVSDELLQTRARLRPEQVREIVLAPLSRGDTITFCAEALRTSEVAPLAELVHDKCGGNPFFTFQFISNLVDQDLVWFDAGWRWDVDAIRAQELTANVVELMMLRLQRLPADTQRVLGQLACIGNTARRDVLRITSGTGDDVHAALDAAVHAGLVHRTSAGYGFLHDRIHEAAYAMIAEPARPAAHLRIARALAAASHEGIFDVVNHFNVAAALIETQAERDQVAELNRQAAERAKAATANRAAHAYAQKARALLGDEPWDRAFSSTFAIELLLGECEFLVGDLEAAEQRLDPLRGHAETVTDRAAVIYMMTVLYTAMSRRTDRAIAICIDYLRCVGIDWPAHPSPELVAAEYEALRARLATRSFEELRALPLLEAAEPRATLDVLLGLMTPAFNSDPNLVALVLCRMANISFGHGYSDASPLGLAFVGMTVGCVFGDFPLGYRIGNLARDLVEARGLGKYRGRVYHTLGTHVLSWTQPVAVADASLRRGLQVMQDTGDVTYVAFAHCSIAMLEVAAGKPLALVEATADAGLAVARSIKFDMAEDMLAGERWLPRALRGDATASELDARTFTGDLTRSWFLIRKLQACVVMGAVDAACEIVETIAPRLAMQNVFFNIVEYHFYGALAHARRDHAAQLAVHRCELARYAAVGEANVGPRLALVDAEIARIEGRVLDAMDHYERAIRSARAQGFLQITALAFETAARLYATRDYQTTADAYIAAARSAYLQWGALAKVRQLDGTDPSLAFERRASLEVESPAFDLAVVVKSSQAVTAEVGLDKLVETLMALALEHAGANLGLLLLEHRGNLLIAAEASVGETEIVVEHRRGEARFPDVPESVANYVTRTRELVLIADARAPNPFSSDAYLRVRQPRSAACIPLVKQNVLVGMLYLENTLTPNVFTNARIAVLELLAAQAATSLQNASLTAENASLAEKEALLKEVHHRVKNNLQLISSLLSLQANRITDPAVAELFSESRNRVRSMALVHENLYRAGNLAKISMELHVRSLVAQLRQAYALDAENIALATRVDDVHLEMSRAVTCGLIINELVSNTLKHAFPSGRPGRAWIELRADDAHATLVVGDDGIGLARGFDLATCSSLGMQLVSDLTAQLHGTIVMADAPGTSFTITFPLADRHQASLSSVPT